MYMCVNACDRRCAAVFTQLSVVFTTKDTRCIKFLGKELVN